MKKLTLETVRIFLFIRKSGRWVTSAQIAEGATVSASTARHSALALVRIGFLQRNYDLYPGTLYKLVENFEQHEFTVKILKAQEFFGL